ncbi:MAG: hypothetical protein IBX50_15995 [Marinospirillum sp.]|uniref:hypothetical protein n=1 Tax=Marinospirillum sp. TaxID=2183934 RepID=UPI0019F6F29D|nr:hypothetical protein [Marinospirillum sp.]MBE0508192.1 hypothetical protein [Marinospirillum sp.]
MEPIENSTAATQVLGFNPMFYVCVMSNFNLPQLEACLARRPSDLVLVVSSDYRPAREGAENLTALLEQELPGIRIHRPDLTAQPDAPQLTGDDALNAQEWMTQVLKPFLDTHRQGLGCWLNLTGGTKATSLAFSTAYPWTGLDYKPSGKNHLSSYQLNLEKAPGTHVFNSLGEQPLPSVSPQQVARIYNKAFKEKSPNHFRANPASLPLAKLIFSGLERQDEGLVCLFNALSRIWSEQRDKERFPQWQLPSLTLPLTDFLQQPDTPHTDLEKEPSATDMWLKNLEDAAPEVFFVREGSITLPGNKANKFGKVFKSWLSGDWLEQLTGHWLQTHAGIPENAMTFGLQAGEEKAIDREREADVLIHHKGKTYLIEVKADVAPGETPADAERQLSSLQSRYGQTETLLMVGPEFRQRLENINDWQGFKARCAYQKVRVCWDAKSLGETLDGSLKPQPTPKAL